MNEKKPSILVMMATYNGEKYVAEQIDSILAQEDVDLYLMIRDDGSTDATCDICAEYAKNNPRIDLGFNEANKGVTRNFMDMLREASLKEYDYFAFSDQDDYWLSNKLIEAIKLMRGREDEPLLYFSDICNTDENLENGKMDFGIFAYNAKSMESLLVRGIACGCTEVLNKALCKLIVSRDYVEVPVFHDAWINLIAESCADTIPDLGRSFIKRRITGANECGENNYSKFDAQRIKNLLTWIAIKPERRMTNTAIKLLDTYGDLMHSDKYAIVRAFAKSKRSPLDCIKLAFNKNYSYPTFMENLILHLRLLFNRI